VPRLWPAWARGWLWTWTARPHSIAKDNIGLRPSRQQYFCVCRCLCSGSYSICREEERMRFPWQQYILQFNEDCCNVCGVSSDNDAHMPLRPLCPPCTLTKLPPCMYWNLDCPREHGDACEAFGLKLVRRTHTPWVASCRVHARDKDRSLPLLY